MNSSQQCRLDGLSILKPVRQQTFKPMKSQFKEKQAFGFTSS